MDQKASAPYTFEKACASSRSSGEATRSEDGALAQRMPPPLSDLEWQPRWHVRLCSTSKLVRKLRDRLQCGLLQRINRASVIGDVDNRLPNTLNMAFEDIESDAILLLLDKFGIAASSGSACASGSMEPSHVLRAMKVPLAAIHGAVRFSFSRENTEEDVDHVLEAMPRIAKTLRRQRGQNVVHGPTDVSVQAGVQA